MSRTNAVEVSIQAVSPLFGTGAAAAEASAGASPPKTPDHTLTVRIVFGCIGGFLRLESRGRSPGISGGSHRDTPPTRTAVRVSWTRRAIRVQFPCHWG